MKGRAVRVILYSLAALTVAVNAVNIAGRGTVKPDAVSPSPEPTAEAALTVTADTPALEAGEYYTVILENGFLNLYSSAGDSAPKMSEHFSDGLFPPEDIALLKEGVSFDSAEAAYEFAENFLE